MWIQSKENLGCRRNKLPSPVFARGGPRKPTKGKREMSSFKITVTITNTDEDSSAILDAARPEGAAFNGKFYKTSCSPDNIKPLKVFQGESWVRVDGCAIVEEVEGTGIYDPYDPELKPASWVFFRDKQTAVDYVRKYWIGMLDYCPARVYEYLDPETLMALESGQVAGPGVRSLEEHIDSWASCPEQEWEGVTMEITKPTRTLIEALGFTPTIAYLR